MPDDLLQSHSHIFWTHRHKWTLEQSPWSDDQYGLIVESNLKNSTPLLNTWIILYLLQKKHSTFAHHHTYIRRVHSLSSSFTLNTTGFTRCSSIYASRILKRPPYFSLTTHKSGPSHTDSGETLHHLPCNGMHWSLRYSCDNKTRQF